ncbi:MAG: sugar ABC transporter permease [Christensenellales bacterium]
MQTSALTKRSFGGRKNIRGRREGATGYLFAFPAIFGFLLLTLYPMATSLFYSFNKIDLQGNMEWVGLQNYVEIFSNPSIGFLKSMQVTILYAFINTFLIIVFCLVVALLLNRKFRMRNLLRAIFYLPAVIPMISTAILWKLLLQNAAGGGLINQFIMKVLHLPQLNFLTDVRLVFVVLFAMGLWTCGGTIVVLLATLQDVPRNLIEAVELDGGNAWHKFRYVTYPTIKPVLFFQLIMCIITSMQVFTQSMVLSSNGAPNRMTYFINIMIYDHSFKQSGMKGIAAAEAWAVFFTILIITSVLFYFQGALRPDSDRPKKRRGGIK